MYACDGERVATSNEVIRIVNIRVRVWGREVTVCTRWGPCDIENPSAGHTNPSFSACNGKKRKKSKNIGGVQIPSFTVLLLAIFWAL